MRRKKNKTKNHLKEFEGSCEKRVKETVCAAHNISRSQSEMTPETKVTTVV